LSELNGIPCGVVINQTAVTDVYKQLINKSASDKQVIRASRIATVVISLLAWILAYYPGGTTFLFAFATAWWAPAGLLLAAGMLSPKITEKAAMAATVIGTICLSAWAVLDLFKVPINGQPIGNYFHMSIVGIVSVLVPAIVVSLFTKPKYYGTKEWINKFKGIG